MASSSGTQLPIRVGILTVSDRCHAGVMMDTSGPNLSYLVNLLINNGIVAEQAIVPDEQQDIMDKLLQWCDEDKLNVIFTTGGTGFAQRDITAEVTRSVIHKEAPGMMIAMLKSSLDVTPLAMLSRAVCGIRDQTLIINLPGSKKGSEECFRFVLPALPHAVNLLRGENKAVKNTHEVMQSGVQNLQSTGTTSPSQEPKSDVSEPAHRCPHGHSHSESRVDVSRVAYRPRESPYPLISVEEATAIVLSHAGKIGEEKIHFTECLGHVISEDVYAEDALPPFPASIKDGYAVLTSDGAGTRLVSGDSTAGDAPGGKLVPGYCVRINTGAPVPEGADAVVQVEDTLLVRSSKDGKQELEIKIMIAPKLGQDIRPVGSDIAKGQKVLQKGQKMGPSEVGILATVGVTHVKCYKRPVIGVMSTGNELMEPGEPLVPGRIRDTNRTSLKALLKDHGHSCLDFGIAKDTPDAVLSLFKMALEKSDIVITSGGVSMGERDILRHVLVTDLGAEVHFGRVFMKPGKPTTFATLNYNGKKKLFFGLPGNPVSAVVTCNLYVISAINKMAGEDDAKRTIIKARVDTVIKLDPRPEYHRVLLTWEPDSPVPVAKSTGNQISSRLLSVNMANALLMLPPKTAERTEISKEEVVNAMIIARL